jgi:hypothetical protein
MDGVPKASILSVGGVTTSDPDAQAFITAAGITNPTQQNAINNLVVGLKADNLWNKMDTIYPFVGGTSTSHKFNLKNPADTNEAFRLVFNGGVTHDSNGVTFNGTTGYADTYWAANQQISTTDYLSISLYSRTDSRTGTIRTDMAAQNFNFNGTTGGIWLSSYYSTGSPSIIFQNDLPNSYTYAYWLASATNSNSTGFYVGIQDATNTAVYKNGTFMGSNTNAKSASRTYSSSNVYIGADNYNGGARRYSDRNFAFAHIGTSMASGDMSNLYSIVQTYQTTLGRQV